VTKTLFLDAARRFLPSIEADDLLAAPAGVRPKFTRPDGVSDFLIQRERSLPTLINLIGIDSPGLSSSMAIADHVWSLLQ
jgi:L-2-hydroxyglutarate oxidase LhgO